MRWYLVVALLITAMFTLATAYEDLPQVPPGGGYALFTFPSDVEQDRPLEDRPTYIEPTHGYPRVILLERSTDWQNSIVTTARLDSLVKYGHALHVHRFRLLTPNGRQNMLNLMARAALVGKPNFMIQGYNYWHHVTYPPGSITWSTPENNASLDSLGSQWAAFKPDGLPSIAWVGTDTTLRWHHADLYNENRPEWNYAEREYVHAWTDVIKKWNRLWGDVPLNGYMFDYPQNVLYNNRDAVAGCPAGQVCDLDLDGDAIVDYDQGVWLNTAARDGWIATQQYMIEHVGQTWPEAWLVVNGISAENGHTSDYSPTASLRAVEFGVASNNENVHFSNSSTSSQNTTTRTFEDRIRWAIAAEQDYGFTKSVLAMMWNAGESNFRNLARTGLVLSCITGQWTMIEVQTVTSPIAVTFETNVARLSQEYFIAGQPLGPAVATELGGGVTRYTRPFENGVARALISSTENGWNGSIISADSIRFDPWP